MNNNKLIKFHVFFINCDCASFYDARTRMPNSTQYMRCLFCKKQLGDMQTQFKGTVYAESDCEAIKLIKNKQIIKKM
jgi:hypothetical protein